MTFKEFFLSLNPRVPKRALVFTASLLWGFAGFKLLNIAFKAFKSSEPDFRIIIPVILVCYVLFLSFIFIKIVRKHVTRIVNKKNEWNCMFSFLDLKGYLIMTVMIVSGITLRKSGMIPLIPLGIVYGIMGLTLFTAALLFLYRAIRFRVYRERYRNSI